MQKLWTLDHYRIRRKFWALFGATFFIEGLDGEQLGYCRQKAFKLKEDIRIYTDATQSNELMAIKARSIIDFGASYDFYDAGTGEMIGGAKRKGLKSILRDSWILYNAEGHEIANLVEDSAGMAIIRRFMPFGGLIPQKFHIEMHGTAAHITIHQAFNLLFYKLRVEIPPGHPIDKRMVTAITILIAAIEGRQSS